MTLSRAEIALIIDEIEPMAGRAVVQRVLEGDRGTRVLQLREPGSTHYLLLSTQPKVTRIHFVDERPDQPQRPSAFTMQLRKWLGGALFEEVTQLNDDRIVRLRFEAVDPDWEPDDDALSADKSLSADEPRAVRVSVALVVELTGHRTNWYLLDGDERIIGQLDQDALDSRELRHGRTYELPTAPATPGVGSKVRFDLDALDAGTYARSHRLAMHYDELITGDLLRQTRQQLESRLSQHIKRLSRRIAHIEKDLTRAEDAGEFRRRGELLQSAWGKVERGRASVWVTDFFDEHMAEVEIPLDPTMNLRENIEYYFHEYHRMKAARQQIEDRLLDAMEQRDVAAGALDDLDAHAHSVTALHALSAQLESNGVLARPSRQRQRRSQVT